jgi:hypothetical protein
MSRAVEADDRIWNAPTDSARHRRARDAAVLEALGAGMSKEQLADELGVLISDIDRMAAAADLAPGYRTTADDSSRR